ncbi:MAG: hypothetical protein ACRCSC_01980 [Lactococcus garvieae]
MKVSKALFEALNNIENSVELREWYHDTTEFDDELDVLCMELCIGPLALLSGIVNGRMKVEVQDEEV